MEAATSPKWDGTAAVFKRALGGAGFLPLALVLVLVVGSLVSPFFLSERNLTNILLSATVVSIVAIGQFFVIVTAGIDLSVGAICAMSTVFCAVLIRDGVAPPLVVLIAIAVAAGIGIINGVLVIYGGITPFIATLGTMGIVQGIAFWMQGGVFVEIKDQGFISFWAGEINGFPNEIIVLGIVTVIATVVMRWTLLGRRLYAVGGNRAAAQLSGLPVNRDTITAYLVAGALAGQAGLILASQLKEGNNLLGSTLALDSIAAAVVGGASLFGGASSPMATVVGGLLIAMIANILNLVNVPVEEQLVITGLVVLTAVFFTSGKGGSLRHGVGSRMRRGWEKKPGGPAVEE